MAEKYKDLQKAIKELTKIYLSRENRNHLIQRIRERLQPYQILEAFPLYKEYGYTNEEIINILKNELGYEEIIFEK